MEKKFTLPPHVDESLAVLRRQGRTAHPVGGCVRDLLLGRTPQDWDVATSAQPEELLAWFPRTAATGGRHGTVTVLTPGGPIEMTPFRREEGGSDSRHPDRVIFVDTLEEDLARRDFTINAMALDESGEVIDPFGGQADLEHRVIRCVGDPAQRFREDALRMFRALRFAAQLDFVLPEEITRAIRRNAPRAVRLSAQRVTGELEKLLCAPRPERAEELFALGLMSRWTAARPKPLTALARLPAEPLLRWAGCLARLPSGGVFLEQMALPGRLARPLRAGLTLYGEGLPQTRARWRHALARYGTEGCRAGAAMGGPEPLAGLTELLEGCPCVTVEQLALSGGDLAALGLSGPDIGASQARLLAHVLDHPEDNNPHRLLALLARL